MAKRVKKELTIEESIAKIMRKNEKMVKYTIIRRLCKLKKINSTLAEEIVDACIVDGMIVQSGPVGFKMKGLEVMSYEIA
jgi:hypothetical protein